jgi:hypothetical protein
MLSHERSSQHPDRPRVRFPGALGVPWAVLNQPGQINVAQWELVEERTGNPEVAWALGVLPNPVTRNNIIGVAIEPE